jgi:hypothetical protein
VAQVDGSCRRRQTRRAGLRSPIASASVKITTAFAGRIIRRLRWHLFLTHLLGSAGRVSFIGIAGA